MAESTKPCIVVVTLRDKKKLITKTQEESRTNNKDGVSKEDGSRNYA